MPSNQKPVIDINSFWVGVLDDIETAFAKTQDGEQVVGYQVSKQGDLVAIPDQLTQRPTFETWFAFREWAKSTLYNPFLVRDHRHTVKKVCVVEKPSPEKAVQPVWLSRRQAEDHERGLVTHNPNDD
jgi:hypothetical protein